MAELHEDKAKLCTAAMSTLPPPADSDPAPNVASKRQRRPSVRLGEIGEQPATISTESHHRKPKTLKFYKDSSLPSKSSKTRPLTNLVNGDYQETLETEDTGAFEDPALQVCKKSKRGTMTAKRSRLNWPSKVDNNGGESDEKPNCTEGGGEFRDFDQEGSAKEQSPIDLVENVPLDYWNGNRRQFRGVNLEGGDEDVVEREGLNLSEDRDLKCGTSEEEKSLGGGRGKKDFLLRNWLVGLGLERYAPFFDVHEVDDDVLPLLTLEDLKDMGIGAVGSRRKMFASIQRLRKSPC